MDTSPRSPKGLINGLLRRIELVPASDRLILRALFFVIIGSLIATLFILNRDNTSLVATRGGIIKEAILGTPRFVNPALAITRADQDVTALVYSGLMKINDQGDLVPDLAENVTVSEDGLTYNIIVRKDARFHDGKPVTAKDVVFTIGLIQNPDLKSPLRGNWADVVVEEIGEYEINVVIEEAYAPFIENFTLGIMPAHLWSNLPIEQLPFSQLNTEPIGSGSFYIKTANRDATGLISSYALAAFRENPETAKITAFELKFYPNESDILEALKNGEADSSAYLSTENLSLVDSDNFRIIESPLPRVFGIFFNQNRSAVLLDDSAREALSAAIDRDALIETALSGYGVPIFAPILGDINGLESDNGTDDVVASSSIERARNILIEGGWTQNSLGLWSKEIDNTETTLSITVRTSNTPLFGAILDAVVANWKEVGIDVSAEQFEQTGLVQSVIRPRDFQALLFGLDMSRSYDLYPFWHSSQKDDPGLNIGQYTNLSVDELLETARTTQDKQERLRIFKEASAIITAESPAVFLFQPNFTYVVSNRVTMPTIDNVGKPSDRFSNTLEWHTKSDTLWPVFQDDM